MPERIENLDGWWIIDGDSGRRFMGHVEKEENGFVFFSKCVELHVAGWTAMLMPMGPPPSSLLRGGPPQGPSVGLQHVRSDVGEFGPPMGLPCLPPWSVKKSGGVEIARLPRFFQDNLLRALRQTEDNIAKAMKDAMRANPNLRSIDGNA